MFNKKVILGLSVFFLIIMLGFIKINTINTKALSPVGNTEDNYELVKEEFGEEFQEFIKDNAEVKIYEPSNSNNNNPTIKVGSKELIVDLNNKVTKQIYNLGGYIYNGFNNIINKFDKKSESDIESSNNTEEGRNTENNKDESNSNNSSKELDNIINNYLESMDN